MACWFVLEPPHVAPGSFEAADKSLFVKDGWSWGALFAAPIWLLWQRMWLVFLGWLAFTVLVAVLTTQLAWPDGAGTAISLGSGLWLAVEGNSLRRWTLARRGWREVGLATGADIVDAEAGFFSRRGVTGQLASTPAAKVNPAWPESSNVLKSEPVLGVFPEPLQDYRR